MMKFYTWKFEIKDEKGKWNTAQYCSLVKSDENEVLNEEKNIPYHKIIETIQEYVSSCKVKKTLFTREEKGIEIMSYGFEDFYIFIKKGECLPVRIVMKEIHPTFEELSRRLSADDFIEYLKERNVEISKIGLTIR